VIKPVFKANGLKWKRLARLSPGPRHESPRTRSAGQGDPSNLRHEDVSTTQRSYIKTVPRVVTDAMKQLEAKIARAAVVQQAAVN
jgi:hypothetical protein